MKILSGLLFLFLLGTSSAPILAQQLLCPNLESEGDRGTIVGRVLDARTRVPVGFVAIQLVTVEGQAPLEARSDRSGRFRFCYVPAGEFSLHGSFGQLKSSAGPFTLLAGENFSLSLQLSDDAVALDTGTLTGLVVDAETGLPIYGATISLPGHRQNEITNSQGRFTFPSLPPGEIALLVNRLGYEETDGQVDVKAGNTVHTRVSLSAAPFALDPIEVTAVRRRMALPGLDDFERRFNSGWGKFILEDEIGARGPIRLTDMLHGVGVQVSNGGNAIRMGGARCVPMVYIDGVKHTFLPQGGADNGITPATFTPKLPESSLYSRPDHDGNSAFDAASAVNMVRPANVRAVEVYRGAAETPGQYLDSNAQCGVILIWTRRGVVGGM